MYYMVFIKRRTSSRLQTTTLGASPPLILGFHPSKRHAALIASCDQDSIVLAFTLVLLVLKHFLWRVMLVILMFVAWFLVDLSCFVAYHLRISCCFCAITFQSYANSCCVDQLHGDNTLLLFHLVDIICYGLFLYLRICVISARLGLANGLDDPVVYQMLCLSLNRELIRESALDCSQASILVRVQLFIMLIRPNHVQDVLIQQ